MGNKIHSQKENFYADETPNEIILVSKFTGGYLELTEGELINTILGSLLKGSHEPAKHPAYYTGGTLCIDYCKHIENPVTLLTFPVILLIFNVEDASLGFPIQAMVAQLYLENKTPKHSHWKKAQEIIARSKIIEEIDGDGNVFRSKEETNAT